MTPCKQAIGKSGTKNSLLTGWDLRENQAQGGAAMLWPVGYEGRETGQITHRLELEYDMQNGIYV